MLNRTTNSPKATELANTINEVFKNEEAAVAKATAAYTLLTSQFTWEQHVVTLESFFTLVTAPK